jgi:hypothetical protein
MSYADNFENADVLHTLSWLDMPEKVRTAKLAHLYLENEREIRSYSRKYRGPTTGTVKPFIKSHFVPPRGQLGPTINGVIEEIDRQRKTRERRREHRPFVWRKPEKRSRIKALAANRYAIWSENWRGTKSEEWLNPVQVGAIGDVFMIVDKGTYSTKPRIYMQHRPTGEVKVVVVEGGELKGITQAMTRISPKKALRAMFNGSSLQLDFLNEGFLVDGTFGPWRNVIKIYHGKEAALQTMKNPKKEG